MKKTAPFFLVFYLRSAVKVGIMPLFQVFETSRLSKYYIHQMASCLNSQTNVLPGNISLELPGYACLLGNLLEASGIILSAVNCDSDVVRNYCPVQTISILQC